MARPAISRTQISRRGVLVAAAGTLFTAACGSDDDSPRRGPTTRGSEELIIGANLELTGPAAATGTLQERAMRITVDQLNEDGVPVGNLRRTIRLVVTDNGSRAETAKQQATEMMNEGVHAILGGTSAETSLAIISVTQAGQTPFVSLAPSDGIALPLTDRTFVYKLTPDSGEVARAMAQLLAGRNLRKVGILVAGGANGASGLRAVTGAVNSEDIQVSASATMPGSGGSPIAAARQVVQSDPDAIVVWAQAPDAGAAARALQSEGFRKTVLFDPSAVAEETLDGDNAAAMEGAFAVHPSSLAGTSLTDTTMADLDRRDFIYRYIQKHGAFRGFAPYASDAVRMIANAARLSRSVDRGRLRAYLETQIAEGIAGSYSFTPISHGGMEPDSLTVFRVTGGSWTRFV